MQAPFPGAATALSLQSQQQAVASGQEAAYANGSSVAAAMYPVATFPGAAMQPSPAVGSSPGGSEQGGEEIRTLFVTGFPPDVHQRELHTLLRFFPGYEASQVRLFLTVP